jgi:hypothetical protein
MMLAERPKKVKLETLNVPVAPVTGMVPFKFTPPLKYDHVTVIALKPTGVMT